jgi:hypothetical protein
MSSRSERARRTRPEAVADRERLALLEYLGGATYEAVAERVGYANRSSARKAVQRALVARAAVLEEDIRVARVLHVARLERLLSTWMPRALGSDEQAPCHRAGEMVLKLMDRLAIAHGVSVTEPVKVDLKATVTRPVDTEAARAAVLAGLEAVREKQRLIDATMRAVETLSGAEVDKPPPPPTLTVINGSGHA